MSNEGPRRTTTEPTLVIPREALAPVSRPILVTDAGDDEAEPETLVPCPANCRNGMVTHERRERLRALLTIEAVDDLQAELDDPAEEP